MNLARSVFLYLFGFLTLITGEKARANSVWDVNSLSSSRHNHLFVPPNLPNTPHDLVVAIHGCLQSAQEFKLGTQLNQIAKRESFLVLYPQQKSDRDPMGCWQWFDPINQRRGMGEPREIVDLIEKVREQYPIGRIFAVGMSSGGAMVSTLLSCYPQLFAGGAIHSGMPYGVASNRQEGVEAMKNGPNPLVKRSSFCQPKDFEGKVLVIHGSKDNIVSLKNAEAIIADFNPPHADEIKTQEKGPTEEESTYPYLIQDTYVGNSPHSRLILVERLGHSWSGGNSFFPFNDELGPNAGELIWDFLIR